MLKWYIACPGSFATGGPEALHQLCYKLKLFGEDVQMFYLGGDKNNPVHPKYEWYKNRYTMTYEDSKDSVLILPEVCGWLMNRCKSGTLAFWWLSWDNFFIVSKENARVYLDKLKEKNAINLSVCEYSRDMLSKQEGIESFMLEDFITRYHKERSKNVSDIKEDIIIYNPRKGINITKELISEDAGRHRWFSLNQGLNQQQLTDALRKAKVYIDFGNHGSRDRFPREAVLYDCCIITGNWGAAANNEDIPIDDKYKWDNVKENKEEIINLIDDICVNYSTHLKNFEFYKERTIKDEEVFDTQVHNLIDLVKKRRGISA